jgi:hypothetical protein
VLKTDGRASLGKKRRMNIVVSNRKVLKKRSKKEDVI